MRHCGRAALAGVVLAAGASAQEDHNDEEGAVDKSRKWSPFLGMRTTKAKKHDLEDDIPSSLRNTLEHESLRNALEDESLRNTPSSLRNMSMIEEEGARSVSAENNVDATGSTDVLEDNRQLSISLLEPSGKVSHPTLERIHDVGDSLQKAEKSNAELMTTFTSEKMKERRTEKDRYTGISNLHDEINRAQLAYKKVSSHVGKLKRTTLAGIRRKKSHTVRATLRDAMEAVQTLLGGRLHLGKELKKLITQLKAAIKKAQGATPPDD